jgi:hypothetical protein
MDSKSELVKNWLIKSQHDLLAAQKLSGEPELYADGRFIIVNSRRRRR